ncbi:MAG: hypothetical protein KDA59_16455, partial [Planctomycetales bacterium]|nr:hypothetical protein [Planctomycetales bacterium]
ACITFADLGNKATIRLKASASPSSDIEFNRAQKQAEPSKMWVQPVLHWGQLGQPSGFTSTPTSIRRLKFRNAADFKLPMVPRRR